MKKKITVKIAVFLATMIFTMFVYNVLDDFENNANVVRWIIVLAAAAWFTYSCSYEDKK